MESKTFPYTQCPLPCFTEHHKLQSSDNNNCNHKNNLTIGFLLQSV